MKILCLYNNECALPLFDWIKEQGHETTFIKDRLSVEWVKKENFDLTVSYTYRYILTKEMLEALDFNAVNLHNSYLPFNRGASPNLWSLAEGTPRGVTLHYMDASLDKGFIIAQRLVTHGDGETIRSSYENLNKNAIELFKDAFSYVDFWKDLKKTPIGIGTYHSVGDTKFLNEKITSYDMKTEDFIKAVRK